MFFLLHALVHSAKSSCESESSSCSESNWALCWVSSTASLKESILTSLSAIISALVESSPSFTQAVLSCYCLLMVSLVWPSPHCPRVSSRKCKSDSIPPLLKTFQPPPPHLPYQVTETGSAHTPSPALLLQTLSALYLIPVLHWGWHHFQFLGSAGLFQSSVYVLVLAWVTFSVWISWQALTHPSKPAQASPLWNLLWLSQGFLYATYSLGSPPDISFFIILY